MYVCMYLKNRMLFLGSFLNLPKQLCGNQLAGLVAASPIFSFVVHIQQSL